jgi:hypothetical protein
LYLKKIKEDDDPALVAKMTRSDISSEEDAMKGLKYLVHFKIEKALQLVSGEESDIKIK